MFINFMKNKLSHDTDEVKQSQSPHGFVNYSRTALSGSTALDNPPCDVKHEA